MPKRTTEAEFLRRVARRIAAARRSAGLTQEQLAAELGIAVRNVQRIESGRQNLTLRTLARIAWTCDITPEQLTGGS